MTATTDKFPSFGLASGALALKAGLNLGINMKLTWLAALLMLLAGSSAGLAQSSDENVDDTPSEDRTLAVTAVSARGEENLATSSRPSHASPRGGTTNSAYSPGPSYKMRRNQQAYYRNSSATSPSHQRSRSPGGGQEKTPYREEADSSVEHANVPASHEELVSPGTPGVEYAPEYSDSVSSGVPHDYTDEGEEFSYSSGDAYDWDGHSCCNGSCGGQSGGCCSSSCCQPRCGGFFVGGGAYYIKPMWTNNQAGVVNTPNGAGGANTTNLEINSDHHWAPFIFAGFVGPCGFGVRGRAFVYDHAANDTLFSVPAAPAGIVANSQVPLTPIFRGGGGVPNLVLANNPGSLLVSSNLRMYVYDLEASQAINYEQWTWTFSGGVRYAVIRQQYIASGTGNGGFGIFPVAINSQHRFDGWGPTLSLEGRRSFGCRGFALYGNARGSLLYGHATQNVTATFLGGVVPPIPDTTSSASRWSLRPVIELEVGGEYGYWMGNCARLFARGGLVGQAWLNAGNASNTGLSGLADDSANLGLAGFRLTAGVDF